MMRRRRTKAALTWLLGIVCILLAWVIYEELAEMSKSEPLEAADGAAPGEPSPTESPATLAMADTESLAMILQRPVFAQTRRPSGGATDGTLGASIDFTLSGVVISGNERTALIRPTNGGTVQQMRIGENVAGWTLIEVSVDRVIVRRDTMEAEIRLDYAAPAPPPPRTAKPKEARKVKPAKDNEDERQMNEAGDPETEPNAASGD
jgi:type II secretory pathway component PulC